MFTVRVSRRDTSILLANALDHFDTALYGFLAPLLAPLFFPHHDPALQLLLGYSVLVSSLVTRPLGVIYFGHRAAHCGATSALNLSLMGLGVSCLSVALLPTHSSIGWCGGGALFVLRGLIGFFAAGEGCVAQVLILEDKPTVAALKISHAYQTSSMVGLVAASAVCAAVVGCHELFPQGWRLCFLAGAAVGLVGYVLRQCDAPPMTARQHPTTTLWARLTSTLNTTYHHLRQHKTVTLRISILSGTSYLTYALPFVFLNGFVPLITSITMESLLAFNTALLVADMLLIPVLGRLMLPYPPRRVMRGALVGLVCVTPLFMGLLSQQSTFLDILWLRSLVVILGVIFLCPLTFYFKTLFVENTPETPLVMGLAQTLGSSVIGRTFPAVGMLLWSVFQTPVAPGLYVSAWGVAALCMLRGKWWAQEGSNL